MGDELILELDGFTVETQPPYETGLSGVSLALRPGALAMVYIPEGFAYTPLADAVQGLVEPDAGVAKYRGEDWRAMDPARAAAQRGTIGRVFDQRGWISNLDVDENITLASRHHTTRPVPEIEQEALELARSFGLDELPRKRPAVVRRADLRRCEWVRALLGGPALIVLEHPTRDVFAEAVPKLVAALRAARARGAAVLWITGDRACRAVAGEAGVERYEFRELKLVPLQGE